LSKIPSNLSELLNNFNNFTTATAEKSFPILRRLKTYQRNTMAENRLKGLAQLSIHRIIEVNSEEVLNELAKTKRKIDIVV